MLKPYRRHEKNCPNAKKKRPREHKNCHCSIWVQGWLGNEYVKNRIDTRDWQVAQYKIREMEAATLLPPPEEKAEPLAIEEAIRRFRRMREPEISATRRSTNTKCCSSNFRISQPGPRPVTTLGLHNRPYATLSHPVLTTHHITHPA
jgi:hypothetical protein